MKNVSARRARQRQTSLEIYGYVTPRMRSHGAVRFGSFTTVAAVSETKGIGSALTLFAHSPPMSLVDLELG